MLPSSLPELASGKTSSVHSDPESGHPKYIPYEKVGIFGLSNNTLGLQITHVRFHVAKDSLLGNETLVI